MEINKFSVILIAIITIIGIIGLMIKMKNGFGPFNLKVFGITMIIGIGAIIALTDISQDRIAPIFGLLGAIAGYLFGLKKEN